MQIKICGITTLREVEFVNELKPDYIGLVFAESKRKVNEEKAFQLCKYLNKEIKTVAVFRNNSFEEIKNVLEKVPIDILQLHGNETEYMVKRIKDIFKGEVWRGINYKEYSEEKLNLIDKVIIDSLNPGSGKVFDWTSIEKISTNKEIILAGGLNINNLDDALKIKNIKGIDISSGAEDINEKPPKREMDMLFTIGEQMSVALMAMALEGLGVPAVSLNAFQAKIHTTSVHGDAKITHIETERIREELAQKKIVIVTGFQGIDENDDYTTLGRGGSDTTAVALAAALQADACEIYTDVDGVYTADPRKVPTAKKLDEISYDDMLHMALNGAQVLHSRCVELAKKFEIPLVVRSSMNEREGTVVREKTVCPCR